MDKITPMLWFDGNAEEAVAFYTALVPDSRVEQVVRAPVDTPSTPKGAVLLVTFSLGGRLFQALNGGPDFVFNEAISFTVDCADQAEVDRYWAALTAEGGQPVECGWCKDRFGLFWQVTPRRLTELLASPDGAVAERVMQAMLTMVKIDLAAIEAAALGKQA